MTQYINLTYVIAASLFIYGLKKLNHPKTARQGNTIASLGMLVAVIVTLIAGEILNFKLICIGFIIGSLIGVLFAQKVEMTAMPQMVALFNGFGGGASALVACAEFYLNYQKGVPASFVIATIFSAAIGTLTFTGSLIAFGKLQRLIRSQPIVFIGQQTLNVIFVIALVFAGVLMVLQPANAVLFLLILLSLSALLGITLVVPIGGADMPVVISLLNSYSGVAAAMAGFILMNNALIITGALVGASGLFLTRVMCKAMNRSLLNVIFGAVGVEQSSDGVAHEMNIKSYSTEEAALIFDAADKIIIVPGYGLAVAQAQHAIRDLADYLESKGKTVLYGIHPVAGRMPGHMNVLLAEARIPYEKLKDLGEINSEFEDCDIALVLGANDVVNPAARNDKTSPIYGMPILDVDKARTVIINKRTMKPGFAGIENELFGYDNAIMVFGDAKEMLTQVLKDLKEI